MIKRGEEGKILFFFRGPAFRGAIRRLEGRWESLASFFFEESDDVDKKGKAGTCFSKEKKGKKEERRPIRTAPGVLCFRPT